MNLSPLRSEADLRTPLPIENTKPCTIILVDDDKDDRLFAMAEFKKSAAIRDVLALPSGTDLISYMKEKGFYDHSVISYSPVLIVLDMQMPTMNGIEVLQDIRADHFLREIPIIVLSSQYDRETVREAYINGATGYLTKPFNLEEIESFLPSAWQWPPSELW